MDVIVLGRLYLEERQGVCVNLVIIYWRVGQVLEVYSMYLEFGRSF